MTWTKGKVASFQNDDSANFETANDDPAGEAWDRLKTWATKKRKGKGGC